MLSLAKKGSGRDIQSTDAVHVTLKVRFGETSDVICNVGSKPESCHDQNSFSVLRNTGRQ
jgi:hypothetical protein